MNFTLSEEQKALQNSVRKFAQTELPEIAKQIEAHVATQRKPRWTDLVEV